MHRGDVNLSTSAINNTKQRGKKAHNNKYFTHTNLMQLSERCLYNRTVYFIDLKWHIGCRMVTGQPVRTRQAATPGAGGGNPLTLTPET